MKNSIKLMLIALLFTGISNAQVKLWNPDKNGSIKTKGAYLEVGASDPAGANFIPAFTVVGTVLPYAIKWGNKALQKATERKEEDYKAEYTSLNKVSFNNASLNASKIFFGEVKYVKESGTTEAIAEKFGFKIVRSGNTLTISFDQGNSELNYSLVKTKKKYDMLITQIKITISADIKVNNTTANIVYNSSAEVGSGQFHYISNSFRGNKHKMLVNALNFDLPTNNSDGHTISYNSFTIGMEITQSNPFGMTESKLNKFLTDNSESTEELLNKLLIKD